MANDPNDKPKPGDQPNQPGDQKPGEDKPGQPQPR